MDENGNISDNFIDSDCEYVLKVDRKNDTYSVLKDLALNTVFEGQEIDPDLFRIRAFNIQHRILLDTYEGMENATLEDLKIYPLKTLALESKPSKETKFTPYDPNLMQLNIVTWRDDILKTSNCL